MRREASSDLMQNVRPSASRRLLLRLLAGGVASFLNEKNFGAVPALRARGGRGQPVAVLGGAQLVDRPAHVGALRQVVGEHAVYTAALHELARQCGRECLERGDLLHLVAHRSAVLLRAMLQLVS